MKKWEQKAIENIMLNFDFEAVHEHMNSVNWKWGIKVPNTHDLIDEAQRRLISVCENNFYYSESGGFVVHRHKKSKTLHLYFAIESWITSGKKTIYESNFRIYPSRRQR